MSALVLATLFIPGVISLVSLYLTVVQLPIFRTNLLNTFWAVWLPSSASAFNVLLVARSCRRSRATCSTPRRSTAPDRSGCSRAW